MNIFMITKTLTTKEASKATYATIGCDGRIKVDLQSYFKTEAGKKAIEQFKKVKVTRLKVK